jgi:hypothetical protein
MAETTPSRSTRDNPARRHFISECRDSRIVMQAQFSPNILRIYRRHFDGVSRAAYLLRFYCRVGPGSHVERDLIKEIVTVMDEINENVRKKISVAEQILKKENVKVSKPQFETVNATIIDPLANRFLQTLSAAQELDEKLSALWLACVIDDDQRRKAMSEIDNDLRSIQEKARALFVGIRGRVRIQNEARQQVKEDEVTDAAIGKDENSGEEGLSESAEKPVSRKKAKPVVEPAIQEEVEVGIPEISEESAA